MKLGDVEWRSLSNEQPPPHEMVLLRFIAPTEQIWLGYLDDEGDWLGQDEGMLAGPSDPSLPMPEDFAYLRDPASIPKPDPNAQPSPPVKVALVGAANILNAAAGTPVPPAPSEVEVLPDPDPELPDPKSVEGEFARSLRMRSDRMGKRRDPL